MSLRGLIMPSIKKCERKAKPPRVWECRTAVTGTTISVRFVLVCNEKIIGTVVQEAGNEFVAYEERYKGQHYVGRFISQKAAKEAVEDAVDEAEFWYKYERELHF
jgi:hypothetical protein